MTNFGTSNLIQIVATTKGVVDKIVTTSETRFGKKMTLWNVDQMAKKVWQATSMAVSQTHD